MKPSEKRLLERLRDHAKQTVTYFSNDNKPLREREIVSAFLKCLGVRFCAGEIVSSTDDPPDVIFRSARIEILEILDEGRKRDDEWKEKVKRLENTENLNDAFEVVTPWTDISLENVYTLIGEKLSKKAVRYGGPMGCKNLDVLLYVNLWCWSLKPSASSPVTDNKILMQGWRSVSFLLPPYSHVIYAKHTSPEFLRTHVGELKCEWNNIDSLFKIEDNV